MCIDTDNRIGNKNGLINTARLKIDGTSNGSEAYLEKISKQGSKFITYFNIHMNYCTACSTSHIGWIKNIFGRNVRLCGYPHFRITSPSEKDLAYIKKFIEFRQEMILKNL
jgi:hypothetical protein